MLRALDEITSLAPPDRIIVPVVLSVARTTTTDRLLFAIIRRVFETLNASGIFHRLSTETRQALLLAYVRTSLSFKETQNNASERAAQLDLGMGTGAAKSPVGIVVPKLNMSMKRSRSLETEASFLAYSETDVEHDLMRIISLLAEENAFAGERRSGIWRLWPQKRRDTTRIHLVVVLDEVDKLTTDDAGQATIESLLAGIKNVLTTSGAHFLLVAGTDMHDRAVKDASRGNSVYESVFAWRMYVPCIWTAPDELIARLARPAGSEDEAELTRFVDYLRFKARGVPRRLLQEFNSFVVWDEDRPYLRIVEADRDRISFYARLEAILTDYTTKGDREHRLFPVAIDNDRRSLGAYYVMDWILRREDRPFTAADLLPGEDEAEFDPVLRVSERRTERLLRHLADHRIVDVVRKMDSSAVFIGDVAATRKTVYKLADDVKEALLGIAVHNEDERAALGLWEPSIPSRPSPGWAAGDRRRRVVSASPERLIAERYELHSVLGQGGMGLVYRGYDRTFQRNVAVKILSASLLDDPHALARFRREAGIAEKIDHPRIVRTYDVVEDREFGLCLVMELLPGRTLRDAVERSGPLAAHDAARLGLHIAGALDYLERQGVARLDLKPSNIMMHPTRGPVIIDFGVARHVDADTAITAERSLVGTPMYMAPEQLTGGPVEIRADIYALGVVMFFSLAGRPPWHGNSMPRIMHQLVNEEVNLSGLKISAEFREVMAKTLSRDPGLRYQHAAELQEAFEQVPELKARDDPADDLQSTRLDQSVEHYAKQEELIDITPVRVFDPATGKFRPIEDIDKIDEKDLDTRP